jgi:hypothetical protein
MARLGEAYVRVRADLKDFDADLDKALKRSTDKFEKALSSTFGRRVGRDVGAGFGAGFDNESEKITKDFVAKFERSVGEGGLAGGRRASRDFGIGFGNPFAVLGGLVTDGFSAVPPQLKAVIGGALTAAIIPVGAALAGALTTGISVGVAGLGALLAFQFEEVEAAGTQLFASLRETFVESAEAFVAPLITAFSRIDEFFTTLSPTLESIFGNASQFIEPLTTGFLGFIEEVATGLDTLLADSDGLVDALAESMITLGTAIRKSLEILSDLGPEGEQALKDLLFTLSALIVGTAAFLRLTVQLYDSFRRAAQSTTFLGVAMKILIPPLALAGVYFNSIDETGKKASSRMREIEGVTEKYIITQTGTVKLTKEQTKALESQADAFKAVSEAELNILNSTLDYQESLLDLQDALKENGNTTATNTRKGIDNVRQLEQAFTASQDRILAQYERGRITQEQAIELYRQQTEEIYGVARAGGIATTEIDRIFGTYNSLFALPPLSDKLFGGFIEAAGTAIAFVQELANRINDLNSVGTSSTTSASITIPRGQQRYANGGIVDTEQIALIGEGNRREVVLPLTNPRRTRELAQESGLMNVLGGDGASTVIVMIGNEQLDSRMYRVANRNSRDQARMMTQGPRLN